MFSTFLSFLAANLTGVMAGAVGALMLHGTGAAVVGTAKGISKVRAGVSHVRAFAAAAVKVAEAARAEAAKATAPAPAPVPAAAPAAPEAPAAH